MTDATKNEATPGPWHLSRSQVLVYAGADEDDLDDHVVAEVYAPNGWDRARADARLIAAAPDMAALLREWLEAGPDGIDWDDFENRVRTLLDSLDAKP